MYQPHTQCGVAPGLTVVGHHLSYRSIVTYHDKKLSGDTITVVYAPRAGSFELQAMPLEALKQTVYSFLAEKE